MPDPICKHCGEVREFHRPSDGACSNVALRMMAWTHLNWSARLRFEPRDVAK